MGFQLIQELKIAPEEVKEWSDYLHPSSCMIDQKPEFELLNQYWSHLQGLTSS